MMGGDGELFLPNMGPRDAWYARMRIVEILVKVKGGHWHVTSYPASYNGEDGYFFKSKKIEDEDQASFSNSSNQVVESSGQ